VTLDAGFKLGNRYEVVRAITSGGMGSIYEARDLQAGGRTVAVKQMLEHLMEGEQAAMFRTKFQAEVNFLRNLQHPGIPQAYDSFAIGSSYYMVMEFIVGRNLEQELEERLQLTGQPFSMEQAIRDGRQVLDILVYLHAQNPPLLHRDIKPANLIREQPSGRIKLVDFGMARLLSEPDKTQTQLGTLGYSPLEQLQGKAEQRSDVYALGATLHHLVTGVPPTVLNIPPVHQLKPDLDPAMAAIIDRACASELNIRFGSAQEMLRALDELRPHLPLSGEGGPPVRLAPLPRNEEMARLPVPPPMEPELPFGDSELPALTLPDPPPVRRQQPDPVRIQPGKAVAPPRLRWGLAQQIGAIALLSVLAFLFGQAVGHQPQPSPDNSPSAASPGVTPEVPSSAVAVVVATPTATATPTPTPTQDPTPIPNATPTQGPKPKPKPKPTPEEEPESFSLSNTPSYPTASTPSSTGSETVSLLDSSGQVELNLDPDWNPIARIQSKGYFYRGFRKTAANFELHFDLKGYAMEHRAEQYRNSFQADHQGWTPATLAGADLAFRRGQGRSHSLEALTLKAGHYYWISLRGKGSGMNAEVFQDELKRVWDSVSLVD
jgi:serine/threonine protein kinase